MYWDKEKVLNLKRLLRSRKTYREIALILGVNRNTIEKAVDRYNLQAQYNPREVVGIPKVLSQLEEVEELDDLKFEQAKAKAKLRWTVPVSKDKKQAKPYKSYLVSADQHVPYQDKPSVKSLLYLMDDVKFDGFVLLGDFMDMDVISHWNKDKRQTLEGKRLKNEYIEGNVLLDEFDKRLPKDCDKRFFMGNHEKWYYDLIEFSPMLEGFLDPVDNLKLTERGYQIYPYNHIEQIGRLHFTHGLYAAQNCVKKHLDECKTNMMFGHVHTTESRLSSSPAKEIALAGYSIGCLCNLNPCFMQNRPSAWSHGFAIVNFFEDGYFDVTNQRIVQGRFTYNQKVYDGNK